MDLGNKLAGTTVICFLNEQGLPEWRQSLKNKDADAFLQKVLTELDLRALFLDAPLSLPGVYRFGKPYEDYFYRRGDRLVKAMSPMFLAGLTARAIRLKDQLEASLLLSVMEAYPKAMAEKLELQEVDYKGSTAAMMLMRCWAIRKRERLSFKTFLPGCRRCNPSPAAPRPGRGAF